MIFLTITSEYPKSGIPTDTIIQLLGIILAVFSIGLARITHNRSLHLTLYQYKLEQLKSEKQLLLDKAKYIDLNNRMKHLRDFDKIKKEIIRVNDKMKKEFRLDNI